MCITRVSRLYKNFVDIYSVPSAEITWFYKYICITRVSRLYKNFVDIYSVPSAECTNADVKHPDKARHVVIWRRCFALCIYVPVNMRYGYDTCIDKHYIRFTR